MKILLVQTSFLGDVILSTPLIGVLRRSFPGAELWMMTTPAAAALVRRDPRLSGVIEFHKRGEHRGVRGFLRFARALRGQGFDRAYSVHRSPRTALLLRLAAIPVRIGFASARWAALYTERRPRPAAVHDVLRNLALLEGECEMSDADRELALYPPLDTDLSPAVAAFRGAHRDYIILVPGSEWRTKRWHVEGYREVARHYLARGAAVCVVGAPQEAAIGAEAARGLAVTDLTGQTAVSDLLALVRGAALVVCNDSMMLHAASAFKVPTVSVFCATSPEFGFGPWRNRAAVVEEPDLWCKPCSRHGLRRCPTGTERCMRVAAPSVIAAAESLRESAHG